MVANVLTFLRITIFLFVLSENHRKSNCLNQCTHHIYELGF